jgi:CDP-glycerol glycerophosphotransferase (TagB/SpsB family)
MEIVYADAHVTSTSTLILDIISNGKQPILYYFDENKKTPFKESIRRFYGTMWLREILKFQIDNIAKDEGDLIKKIKEITQNPNKDLEKRERLLERLCYRVDGKSNRRIVDVIDTCCITHQPLHNK